MLKLCSENSIYRNYLTNKLKYFITSLVYKNYKKKSMLFCFEYKFTDIYVNTYFVQFCIKVCYSYIILQNVLNFIYSIR